MHRYGIALDRPHLVGRHAKANRRRIGGIALLNRTRLQRCRCILGSIASARRFVGRIRTPAKHPQCRQSQKRRQANRRTPLCCAGHTGSVMRQRCFARRHERIHGDLMALAAACTGGARGRGRARQSSVSSVKIHRGAILRGEPLQSYRRASIAGAAGVAIGVQHRDPAPIGLLELRQLASRAQPELAIQVEKISLVRHRHPPGRGVETWREAGASHAACNTDAAQRRRSVWPSIRRLRRA